MTRELTDTILRVVERAPDWIRRDLDSKVAVVRIRAEESLAAMIADALAQQAAAEVCRLFLEEGDGGLLLAPDAAPLGAQADLLGARATLLGLAACDDRINLRRVHLRRIILGRDLKPA